VTEALQNDTLTTMNAVVFDLETTGLSPARDAILEIGAMVVENGVLTGEVFHTLVNPGRSIPYFITRINGIRDSMVRDAPSIQTALPGFLAFIDGRQLVAHNASFDMGFIRENARRLHLEPPEHAICTVELSKRVFPRERAHNLDAVCSRLGLVPNGRHRALADVEVTAQAFVRFQEMIAARV
jgi:DNA polymerase III subunit epsilon